MPSLSAARALPLSTLWLALAVACAGDKESSGGGDDGSAAVLGANAWGCHGSSLPERGSMVGFDTSLRDYSTSGTSVAARLLNQRNLRRCATTQPPEPPSLRDYSTSRRGEFERTP